MFKVLLWAVYGRGIGSQVFDNRPDADRVLKEVLWFTRTLREADVEHNPFTAEALEAHGFWSDSLPAIQKIIERKVVYPQELARILSSAGRDRAKTSKALLWLMSELGRRGVSVATSKKAAEYEEDKSLVPRRSNGGRPRGKSSVHTGSNARPYKEEEVSKEPEPEESWTPDISRAEEVAYALYKTTLSKGQKLLSPEEERELGRLVMEKKDLSARNKLVERNLGLAGWMARRHLWSGISFEDLLQEGTIGLIKAADKYDYRIGRFSTYATWWVRQAITRHIACNKVVHVPHHLQEEYLRLVNQASAFALEKGRAPSVAELAEKSGLRQEKVRQILNQGNVRAVSLDAPIQRDDSSSSTLGELLPDSSSPNGLHLVEAKSELRQTEELVTRVLQTVLSSGRDSSRDRQHKIFCDFYGLGSGERRTLEEVGKSYGVSRERIRQIIEKIWGELERRRVLKGGHSAFILKLQSLECLRELVAESKPPSAR